MIARVANAPRGLLGVVLCIVAAFGFGSGGAVIKPLFEAGWSPGAAVLGRLIVAAIVLTIPALALLRFDLRPLLRSWKLVLAYGAIAVAGVQLMFYASLERIPVSIALLIEYLAPVALLLLAWARTRRTPHRVVLLGAVVSIAGLVLVIGPTGSEQLDPLGLVLAAIAMCGVAFYYAMGSRMPQDVPQVAIIWAGFVVGGAMLALVGAVGILPMEAVLGEVDFLGSRAPWWAPLVTVGVVATALAYIAGIAGISLLGTRLSSFLGLSEVVFAGIVSWILLGEAISPLGLVGAALILGGIVLVRMEPSGADAQTLPEPIPATGPIEIVEAKASAVASGDPASRGE